MKKYTNKILWGTAIAVVVLLIVGISVDFQVNYHKHPERFKMQVPESGIIVTDEDSASINVNDTINV